MALTDEQISVFIQDQVNRILRIGPFHLEINDNLFDIFGHAIVTERIDNGIYKLPSQELLDDIYHLNMPIEQLNSLSPDVYSLILYYELLSLNGRDPVSIDHRNTHGVFNVDKVMNDIYLRKIRDTKYPKIDNFPLRVIYASLIRDILFHKPLDEDIHSYIAETLRSDNVLTYKGPPGERMKIYAGYVDGINRYYDSFDNIPLSELLFQSELFGQDGFTFHKVTFAEDIPMFGLMARDINSDTLLHEYMIGLELNKLYRECPFVVYTYMLMDVYSELIESCNGYVPVFDNKSIYGINGSIVYNSVLLLTQWIDDVVTMREFVDHLNTLEPLKDIILIILASIKYLFDTIGFIHGDLNMDNIYITTYDNPVRVKLPGYDEYVITRYVPIIYNYEKSVIINKDIFYRSSRFNISPYDDRFNARQKYIIDVHRFTSSLVRGISKLISTDERQSRIFWADMTDFVNHYFIGRPVGDDLNREILGMRLLYYMSTYDDRSLPIDMISYNPNGAIENLIHKWIKDDDGESLYEPNKTSIYIDAMISNDLKDGKIVIETYQGGIFRDRYSQDYTIYVTPRYQDTFNYVLNRLNEISSCNQYIDEETIYYQRAYKLSIMQYIKDRWNKG